MKVMRPLGPLPVVIWRWAEGAPGAAARARIALRCALNQLGYDAEVIDDMVICVAELVANSIEHAVGPYEIRLRMTGGEVVCEVEDCDPCIPRMAPFVAGPLYEAEEWHRGGGLEALASVLAVRGRGLSIVHALTNGAWGFRASGATKTAWLVLPAARGE